MTAPREITTAYDATERVGSISRRDGSVLTVRNVTREQFDKVVAGYRAKTGARADDCAMKLTR